MKVIATVQSPGNDPVEIQWVKDGDALDVVACVAGLLRGANPVERDQYTPTTLSIRIELAGE